MSKVLAPFDFRIQIRFSILLFLVLISSSFGNAQMFTAYGAKEGLSQEYVNTIIKDHLGFIWIGTQDGLNRFDGYEFKVFKKNRKDPNSLSGNFINTLIQDSLQNIWIGTKNNGLCYYDYTQEQFRSVDIEGLAKNAHCNQLTIDENGIIYAAFLQQGIVKIIPQKDSSKVERLPFFNNITTLKTINGRLLVGTREGQIYFKDTQTNNEEFKLLDYDFQAYKIHAFSAFNKNILIGTDEGLFLWQPEQKNISRLNNAEIKNTYIYDIVVKRDEVYLATDSGLYHAKGYSEEEGFRKITPYTEDEENGLQTNLINHLLLEKEELWLGGNRLYYTSLRNPIFKNSPYKVINNSLVYTINKHQSDTWIGTAKGLYLATKDQLYHFSRADGLPHDKVRHIAIDRNNNLWVGTQKGIVTIALDDFNPKVPKLQLIPQHPTDSLRLQNLKIRDLFVDRAGQVWVATLGGGVHRFIGDLQEADFRFQHFKNKSNDTNSLNTNVTYAFYQDSKNTYWVGTERGVNTIQFKNGDFSQALFSSFTNHTDDSTSLSNNTVLSFLEDSNGSIWIGTLNGLNKYLPDTKNFKIYNEEHGLTNGVVYAMLEDGKGKIWLSTNTGIFCFDPKSERFTQYRTKDGLQNDEYTLGAAMMDKEGQLYFGGGKGYNYFHPDDLENFVHNGQLVFTDLQINEQAQVIEPKVSLAYDEFPIYLKFSDLNYAPQKNNQYLYQLSPKDNQWNALQDRREIQFLSLAPGKYELLIQGKTRTKNWNTSPLKINIQVSPPWWQSPWMYGLYILAVLGLGYWIYHFLLSRKLQQEETKKLKEINTLKTQLYTNITHEFRTPITVIKGLTNYLKDNLSKKNSTETQQTLDTINHNSNQVLSLVNQMLDLAKLDKRKFTLNYTQSDVIWFLERIVAQFSSYASSKKINITFYSEVKNQLMDFDRDALQKVMSNLLSNAIKYSDKEDTIIVHTRVEQSEEKNLIINVKDTGKGIHQADLPHIFDRFYQTKYLNGSPQEGTGIGLTLTRELIQLMRGNIGVESEKGQGTTFILSLPIKNEAEIETQKEVIIDTFARRSSISSEPDLTPISDDDKDQAIILLVDDNEDIISLLQLMLKERYQLVSARNGGEGISKAIETIPDIIISDVMMPDINGFELCEQIKANEKTSHIPIILLTAKATDQDRLLGLSKGADAFITKPFQKAELFIRIEELTKLRSLLYQKYTSASAWDAIEKPELVDKDAAFINSVLFHIEQSIDDPQFNAIRLAKKLDLSESQLYRKLKAITDSSTANFIRKVRLQKAKSLLQSSELTVSEIAYQTGFSSPSWFSRAFKQEFGFPPNELRK